MAVFFATVFKTITYDMSADIDLDHLKELSQNFKQSSTKQFAGKYLQQIFLIKLVVKVYKLIASLF